MKILVYIQQDEGKINSVSLEALKGAQDIAAQTNGTVSALSFNAGVCSQLTGYDVAEVLVVEDDNLNTFNPLFYLKALEDIAKAESPDIIVFGHTYEARDWAPRLSARLDIPFISDCIGFKNEDKLTFIRSIYQGKFNSDSVVNNGAFIVSFQSGAFRVDGLQSGSADIRQVTVDLSGAGDSIAPEEKFQEAEQAIDLNQADVIVSVGRGIGKEENIELARELSKTLGGEIASSRPVVDAGWLESSRQVGSSGQTVSPKLYLALGISGAIQHIVGMKGSKNIVVINKDKNAPLFEIADYGVVGDLFEIVPKLTEMIQNS